MKLTCVCGRAGSGKSRYIAYQVGQAMQAGRAILLVPDQFTLQAERELIAKLQVRGLMQAEVMSFTRLCERVLALTGDDKQATLSARGRTMAVTRLLHMHQKDLKMYGGYIHSPSFASELCDAIAELKRFHISPQALRKLDGGAKFEDIALIYEAYIQAGYQDAQDKMDLAIAKLEASGMVQGVEIFIDGFEMLTTQVYALVEQLIRCAAGVTITFRLPHPQDQDAYIFATEQKHYRTVLQIADRLNAPIEEVRLPQEGPWGSHRHTGVLAHLEKQLFAFHKQRYAGKNDAVAIISAGSPAQEADWCAYRMYTLARDAGMRWRDMAIVCNDMEHYAPFLQRAFQKFGVSCFLDVKRQVTNHPFARFVMDSLACVKSGFSTRDVLRMMKTGFAPLDMDDCDRMELLLKKAGVRWVTPSYIANIPEQADYEALREGLLTSLYAFADVFQQAKTVSQKTRALYAYLVDSGAVKKLEALSDTLRERGNLDKASEMVAAYQAVCAVMEQAHDVLGDTPANAQMFYDYLAAGLKAEEIGIIPTMVDGATAGTLQRSRSGDIRALFVLGANEGILPAGVTDTGLVTVDDRALLAREGLYMGHDEEERISEEELLIYATLSKPSQRLFLSYAQRTADNGEGVPSQIIEEIEKCIPVNREQADVAAITLPDATLERAVHALAWEPSALWHAVAAQYRSMGDMRLDEALALAKRPLDLLGRERARRLYGTSMEASPSKLGKFALCPFQMFALYALKVREPATYGYTPVDKGNCYHAFTERFVNDILMQRLDWETITRKESDAIAQRVYDAIAEEVETGQYAGDGRTKAFLRELEEDAKGTAWAIVRQIANGAFRPLEAEQAFSRQTGGEMQLYLETGEKAYVQGKIDRLDVYETDNARYVRVIDYKSGNKTFSPTQIYYGTDLQLPLYLAAAAQDGDMPAGMYFMPVREKPAQADNEEEIEREHLKAHALRGIMVNEPEVLAAMERDLQADSDILPIRLKSDGSPRKSESLTSQADMERVLTYSVRKAASLIEEIYQGQAAPKRVEQGGQHPGCMYCALRGACGFEMLRGDRPERFTSKKIADLTGGEDI